MKLVSVIAFWLLILGSINWGLVAFFDFDMAQYAQKITKISSLAKILYALVFASGIVAAIDAIKK